MKGMTNPRYRPLIMALAALVVVWLVAWAGFRLAAHSRMTADKYHAYASRLNLAKLQGQERARALRELADKLNRLPLEERRRVRMERGGWSGVFEQMTEQERGDFIEATMPTGFKQMLTSFEQLTPDKRKRAVDRALKQLRAQREGDFSQQGTDRPPEMSEELQKKMLTVGLNTFYKESSAQTKAEMVPLLEELQRTMENGRLFHQ